MLCPKNRVRYMNSRRALPHSSITLTLKTKGLVGAARFELTTPCAQGIGTYELRNPITHIFSMRWPRIVYSQNWVM